MTLKENRRPARFFAYKTTFHSGKEENSQERYRTLDTSYHIEFHCRNGNSSIIRDISDKEDFIKGITQAKAEGFTPAQNLPSSIPTMQKFSRPKTIEGVAVPARVVLNTTYDPTKR